MTQQSFLLQLHPGGHANFSHLSAVMLWHCVEVKIADLLIVGFNAVFCFPVCSWHTRRKTVGVWFWFSVSIFPVLFCRIILMCLVVTFHFLFLSLCPHFSVICWPFLRLVCSCSCPFGFRFVLGLCVTFIFSFRCHVWTLSFEHQLIKALLVVSSLPASASSSQRLDRANVISSSI